MMIFRFGPPAHDLRRHVFAALAGMTGTGKTYSAMCLMAGLCGNRPWALGDTEGGRGAAYHITRLPKDKGGFDFGYTQLEAPYTQDSYAALISSAVAAGYAGLIIDSGSHLWEGSGGVREQAAEGTAEGAEVPFQKWAKPKMLMWQVFETAKQAPMHVIVCLRAKPKKTMVKVPRENGRGFKNEVVALGTLPIMDSGIWHEFDFLAVFEPERPGVPLWTAKGLSKQYHEIFLTDEQITEEHGRKLALALSAAGGAKAAAPNASGGYRAPAPAPQPAAPNGASTVKQRAQEIADAMRGAPNAAALRTTYARLAEEVAGMPEKARTRLAEIYDEVLNGFPATAAAHGSSSPDGFQDGPPAVTDAPQSMAAELDGDDDPAIAEAAGKLRQQWAEDDARPPELPLG